MLRQICQLHSQELPSVLDGVEGSDCVLLNGCLRGLLLTCSLRPSDLPTAPMERPATRTTLVRQSWIWLVTGGYRILKHERYAHDFAMFRKCYKLCYTAISVPRTAVHPNRPDFALERRPRIHPESSHTPPGLQAPGRRSNRGSDFELCWEIERGQC